MAESSSFPDGSGGITEEWLKALRNASCLKLKDLLHYRSGLIAVYLEEKEWDKNYKCTALHVAVKAGCTELVDTILDIFEDVFKDICEEFETLSYGTEVSTVQPHPELDEGGILAKRTVPEARALLKELLSAIDGYLRLNALAIAVVNKNPRVVHILLRAYSRFGYPTFTYLSSEVPDASSEGSSEGDHNVTPQVDDEHFGEKLCNTIRGVVEMGSLGDVLRENFKGDSKLNFLPWEEYMYHHVVGNDPIRNVGVTTKFLDLLGKKTSEDLGLARYLLKLRDGSGRTPISSAVSWHENNVFSMIPDGPGNDDCLNITDFAGRTLLHRAAANGPETCLRLLVEDYRTNLNAVVSAPKKFTAPKTNTDVDLYDIDIDALSADHNYSTHVEDSEYKATPLYLAIVHSKEAHVKHLLHAEFDYRRHPKYRLDLNLRCVCDVQYFADFTSLGSRNLQPSVSSNKRLWTPLQLAALMGQEQTLTLLANDDRAYDPGRLRNLSKKPGWTGYQAYTACQLSAASGNPVALRELLDSKKFDPLFKDEE